MAVQSSTGPNAFKTMMDTIVAPKEAFESIRAFPTWGLALAVTILLSAIGTYLMTPAMQHAATAAWPAQVAANPKLAQMPLDQQQSMLAMTVKFMGFIWVFSLFVIPIYCLIEALVMLLFDKIGRRGEGTFVQYFAACCNIAFVVAGLGTIITAAIVVARGPQSFTTSLSVQQAMPTLALLAPGAGVKLQALLGAFTPFTIWATILSAIALLTIGRVSSVKAWIAAIALFVVPALLAVAGAR